MIRLCYLNEPCLHECGLHTIGIQFLFTQGGLAEFLFWCQAPCCDIQQASKPNDATQSISYPFFYNLNFTNYLE